MWSSINENIIDGTSGLTPNSQPKALVIGTSSKGTINTPISLGKKSNIQEIFGYGELPNVLSSMQETMGDSAILALRSEGDIVGSISEITALNGFVDLSIAGSPLCNATCNLEIYTEGTNGQAEIKLSTSQDKNSEQIIAIPEDGIISLLDLGISLIFPLDMIFSQGHSCQFSITAPTSSYDTIAHAITSTLETYSPEIVVISKDVNAVIVSKLGALAEQLFEDHKPTLFLTHSSLDNTKNFNEAIADKQLEFNKTSARFVSVVCQPLTNKSSLGLCAGHICQSNVNQSIGATNYFAVYNASLPPQWSNVHSRTLDEHKFITLRTYAGLNNLFWSNGKTMAESTSDYRYIEIVRTVFKAIRLARHASLPFIHAPADQVGIENLLTTVRSSLEGMTTISPKELDGIEIYIEPNQDIVNNGIQLDISLFGVPIIRTINLNFMFKYQQGE